ncbi:MAG TPA: riboflavin synthase [Myxococcales bacterium]|nr:riboflavin synthase [Myxococcales bacterium]HIK84569.1 riboflavin synthase [Myxococcales bacterium]
MFTGIVETIGKIQAIEQKSDLAELEIDLGPIAEGVKLGDSIAVAGCCLTVSVVEPSSFRFEAIPETLEKTRIGGLAAGDVVNLERAMSSAGRFDGHLVQGHVDGVGRVRRFDREQHEALLHIACGAEIAGQLVDKGSVTIDGVSLTVVEVVADGFHVALIPYTLEVTTLSDLEIGDTVNLEVDIFGKYVKQYLDRVLPNLVASAQAAGPDASN